MLDIEFIRQNKDLVQTAAKNKNVEVDLDTLLKLDDQRRSSLAEIEALRAERNTISQAGKPSTGLPGRQAGSAPASQKPTETDIKKGKELKNKLADLEAKYQKVYESWLKQLKSVPNVPLDDVPIGRSEDDNQIAKTVGEQPKFDFEPKNHAQLGEDNDYIDTERAAKVAGARFAYLKGGLVRLHFALMQFGLDALTDETILASIAKDVGLNVSTKPFVPVLPPAMARTEVYEATGRLDGEDVTYKLADDELWLNASAEHTLCPMYKDEIVAEADLPLRFVGYTTAFRREAGTYGKDMEGIFRLHQFDKLEMESFSTAETGRDEHLFMVAIQEYLMQQLDLPYQVILKCSADIGSPNARGVDINTWLPGQGKYRETHTADYMGDYQARRLQTRVRRESGAELVHTNDATAFAQRTLIAILENYQTKDGTIRIPKVLQSYLKGETL